MPKNFWKVVNEVIGMSDILLLILDARLVDHTRNAEIEEKIEKSGKGIIYVINKSDLVDKRVVENIKNEFNNCVFMSAKKHQGTNVLRSEIMKMAGGKEVVVGILGYPNVGKSSVINAISGSGGKAGTGHKPGYTRGVQKIRISQKMLMLDTPGVLPFMEKDEIKHMLIGCVDPQRAKDPEDAAIALIENNEDKINKWYSVEFEEDGETTLEKIAINLKFLKSGGKTDLRRTSIKILYDWQKGKII